MLLCSSSDSSKGVWFCNMIQFIFGKHDAVSEKQMLLQRWHHYTQDVGGNDVCTMHNIKSRPEEEVHQSATEC